MRPKRKKQFRTPLSGENLGYLLSWVFGVHVDRSPIIIPPQYVPIAAEVTDAALETLAPNEEVIVRMRVGLNSSELTHTQESIAQRFGVTRHKIRAIQEEARHKLKQPSTSLKAFLESPEEFARMVAARSASERLVELVPVIETIRRLEPALIAHLQKRSEDLNRIHPDVFEHLIAEFLTYEGFSDVRLVGRNPKTSADIYAALCIPCEIPLRVFVEVKRRRKTLGIEVINEVLGAFLAERKSLVGTQR